MKMRTKLWLLTLLVVVLVSAIALTACNTHECKHVCPECGKCTDETCYDPVCSDKCSGHSTPEPGHQCQHVCHECGKCTDTTCIDSECGDKCEGHETIGHECSSKCPECGKCTDNSCDKDACKGKCQGHGTIDPTPKHECQHVCSECGKCTDTACADDVCKDKCLGHGTVKHECQSKCTICGKCTNKDCTEDVCKDKCGEHTTPTPTVYTVTFIVRGEDYASIRVASGSTIAAPATDPTTEGKTFRYWTILDDGAEFNFATPITSDITLEAVFAIYVDFDINGATGTTPEGVWGSSTSASVTMPSATNFSRVGYIFGGWTDGLTTYQAGATAMFRESTTLTAIWTTSSAKYTVTFFYGSQNASEIKGETPASYELIPGESIVLPQNPWTRIGHTFKGWTIQHYVIIDDETQYWEPIDASATGLEPGATYPMPSENVRVTAQWQEGGSVAVTYHSNTDANLTSTDTFEYGKSYWLKNNMFTAPTGKVFAGWSLTPDGVAVGDEGDAISAGTLKKYVTEKGEMALDFYALWTDGSMSGAIDIAAISGVWTSGSSTVIISTVGADGYYVGSAIVNNEYVLLADYVSELVGYNLKGDEIVITSSSSNQIAIKGTIYTSKTAISNAAISDFVGEWLRQESPITLKISAQGKATLSLGSASNVQLVIVDKYIAVTYTINGAEYQFVLGKSGSQLVGYYTAPEYSPVATTFDFVKSEPEVDPSTDLMGATQFAGNSTKAVSGATIKGIMLHVDREAKYARITYKYLGTTSTVDVELTNRGTGFYWGNLTVTYYYRFNLTIGGSSTTLCLAVVSNGTLMLCDSSENKDLSDGKFTVGTITEDPTDSVFTGAYTHSTSTYTLAFSRFQLDTTQKATSIDVTYSLNGAVEKTEKLTLSNLSASGFPTTTSGTPLYVYSFQIERSPGARVTFRIAIFSDHLWLGSSTAAFAKFDLAGGGSVEPEPVDPNVKTYVGNATYTKRFMGMVTNFVITSISIDTSKQVTTAHFVYLANNTLYEEDVTLSVAAISNYDGSGTPVYYYELTIKSYDTQTFYLAVLNNGTLMLCDKDDVALSDGLFTLKA